MPPAAVGLTPGHHDSFSLPQRVDDDVHPSATRGPSGGLIKVESESTVYGDDVISARFTDRGAEVTSECFPLIH